MESVFNRYRMGIGVVGDIPPDSLSYVLALSAHTLDAWESIATNHAEIPDGWGFRLIQEFQLGGVFCLSCLTEFGDVYTIPYPLNWEFM